MIGKHLSGDPRVRAIFFLAVMLLTASLGCGESDSPGAGVVKTDPWPPDPEIPGPFAVASYPGSYEVTGFGTFSALIYYPTGSRGGAKSKKLPEAPYPAVVLSNGYTAPAAILSWLSEHLASHGYVVLGFTPQNPFALDLTNWADGFRQGLATLGDENYRFDAPVFGLVQTDRAGLIGLSMGGAGAIEAAGSGVAADAVVALAPGMNDLGRFIFADTIEAAKSITVPVQVQIGTRDCIINPEEGTLLWFTRVTGHGVLTYYDVITARKLYLEITGANHVAYIDEGIAEIGNSLVADLMPLDCLPDISTAEQHRIVAKYATMWFDTYLYGTDRWSLALFGPGIRTDLATGVLSAFKMD